MRPVQILPPPPPRSKRRRKKRSWLLSLLTFAFASGVVLFLAASSVVGFYVWKASRDLPDYERLAKYEPPVMTRIHANDGALMAEYARERRIFVPINVVPKMVIQAFLAAEDRRFYEHGGLDFTGIARAIYKNFQNWGKRRPEGASTITQQVAKNFLLSNKQDLDRKFKEALLAIRIERTFPKEKILELYLNEIYLGMGSYGIAAAALNYFGKELAELQLEEAAYLAALPKAPNNYHPFRKAREATERRNWILDQMAEAGYVPADQARAAKAKALKVNIRPFGTQIYAADYFAEEVRRRLVEMYGEDGLYGRTERTGGGGDGVNGGLSVRTTLDPNMQKIGRRVLIDGLVAFDRERGAGAVPSSASTSPAIGACRCRPSKFQPTCSRGGSAWCCRPTAPRPRLVCARSVGPTAASPPSARRSRFPSMRSNGPRPPNRAAPKAVTDVLNPGDVVWVAPKNAAQPTGVWSLMQIPEIGGGLIAMDPHTGRVHAVVGGFSFSQSQFDRALQAKRQPGSSYKPFVYATALDNGYKPTSIVLDAPIEIEQGAGKEVWTPKNYDGTKSYGPSTLRVGIEKSRNQMTVRLAQDMGMPMIVEYSKRFGVYDDLLPVLAMSLGSGETTLVKLAAAYSTFANGGKHVKADADRPHPGSLGPDHLALRRPRMSGLQGGKLEGPGRADAAGGRPQADHRPAHGLPDHLDDGGRDPARHGNDHQADPPQCADGRQDRHHQRRKGCLVRRLHARPRGRCLHRLRLAAPHGQGHDRRPCRRAHLRALHEGCIGRQESGAVPNSARGQACAREPANGAQGARRGRRCDA